MDVNFEKSLAEQSLRVVEIEEIRVEAKGGSLISSAFREAAVLALVKDCRVTLVFNGLTYEFDPDGVIAAAAKPSE